MNADEWFANVKIIQRQTYEEIGDGYEWTSTVSLSFKCLHNFQLAYIINKYSFFQ